MQEPNPHRRADYGGLALVFSELTDHTTLWKKELEGWNVEQSPQVLEWQQEARRSDIKQVLEYSIGSPPNEALALIDAADDHETLDRCLKAALEAKSFEEFQKLVAQNNGA